MQDERISEELVAARVTVDGRYAKAYMNEKRIANAPRVELAHGDRFGFVLAASDTRPIYIGSIRIAAGGRDSYDKLAAEGRVATQGILFDVDSDLELSIRRAEAVRAYRIETYGIDKGRLEAEGFGETKSVADIATAVKRRELKPPGRALSLLLCGALTAACGGDHESDASSDARLSEAEPTQLECEKHGYPCTWAEVPPEVLLRTDELADRAAEMLTAGSSISDVVAALKAEDDLAEVMSNAVAVRFRLEGGRAVGILSPEGTHPGYLAGGPPPPQSREATDAVGDEERAGEKPLKKALLLEPYRWEYRSPDGPDPATSLRERFDQIEQEVRDYSGCDDGCVDHFYNDWYGSCHPGEEPDCAVDYGVTIDHFKNWDKYQVIHVVTHGTEWTYEVPTRDSIVEHRIPAIATGRVFDHDFTELVKSDDFPGKRFGKQRTSWLFETGVELWQITPTKWCDWWKKKGQEDSAAYKQWCPDEKGLYREYLTVDFFFKEYPQGLEDKLIFLAACYSMTNDDRWGNPLVEHLAGNDRSAVLGWTEAVVVEKVAEGVDLFYRFWIGNRQDDRGGMTVRKAFEKTNEVLGKAGSGQFPLGIGGAAGLTLGSDDDAADEGRPARPARWADAELLREGSRGKRGREVVFLVDPESAQELQDGGRVETIGAPGDGVNDSLRIDFEVIGVSEEDDPRDFVLTLRVGSLEVADEWLPEESVGEGVWRRRGSVPLGFDTREGQVEDLEVRTELPGGGQSRWLYEDVQLGGAFWRMSLTGGDESGEYSGSTAEFRLVEDGWEANSFSFHGTAPLMTTSGFLPAGFKASTGGGHSLCRTEEMGECLAIVLDPFSNDAVSYQSGDGVSVDYPYDGGVDGPAFRYPPPAQLTITRVTDAMIEGRIEGPMFKKVITPKARGHSMHFVTGSVSIDFAARRLKSR